MDKDTGGQAFPSTTEQYHGDGMTLRDYYKGQAMQAFITAIRGNNEPINFEQVADASGQQADAMLKERNKDA